MNPQGTLLATASLDTVIRRLCEVANPGVTAQDRSQYAPDRPFRAPCS